MRVRTEVEEEAGSRRWLHVYGHVIRDGASMDHAIQNHSLSTHTQWSRSSHYGGPLADPQFAAINILLSDSLVLLPPLHHPSTTFSTPNTHNPSRNNLIYTS